MHERRPRCLDLFCGAGGAGKGYHDAGFEVVGVDITVQAHYPYECHRFDALKVLSRLLAGRKWKGYALSDFSLIHASPPCQRFSGMSVCRPGLADDYPDLITAVRDHLKATRVPYVIENVVRSPLLSPVVLCGTMFGLPLYRHRLFETSFFTWAPRHPPHVVLGSAAGHYQAGRIISVAGNCAPIQLAREAMGIDWTNRSELAEAIPPAYTRFVGRRALRHLQRVGHDA